MRLEWGGGGRVYLSSSRGREEGMLTLLKLSVNAGLDRSDGISKREEKDWGLDVFVDGC